MSDKKRLLELLEKTEREELSSAELSELETLWIAHWEQLDRAKIFDEMVANGELITGIQASRLFDTDTSEENAEEEITISIPWWRRRWTQYAASVMLMVAIGIITYLVLNQKDQIDNISLASQEERFKNDIPAAISGAVLQLADGTEVLLDDKNGVLVSEGAVKIIKDQDRVSYQATAEQLDEKRYNTLVTPQGRYISVMLSDGTIVWLNAASQLQYPVVFTGKERKVKVVGEAYFEVKKNPGQPFIVEANGTQIEVTGTQFNVHAYDDEPEITTTLVEGGVIVRKNNHELHLVPGQQAIVRSEAENNTISLNKTVNISQEIAWTKGLFHFEKASVADIMKELKRWYNLEVEFKAPITEKYYLTISRQEPISKVLRIIEKTGNVRFTIEDRHVVVYP
jgi:transmembrane sensor